MTKQKTAPKFKPTITLSQALTHPDIFGGTFNAPSFWTWRVVAKLIDGISLTEQREVDLYQEATGRRYDRAAASVAVRRLVMLVGRRGGKDRFMSAVAVWRAALCADWSKYMSAGEFFVCLLLGRDRRQAAILRRYCEGLLRVPMLAEQLARRSDDAVEFVNGVTLEIGTNNAALIRGRSAIAILGSEVSFWRTDSSAMSSDEEVIAAASPSMAMCPDGGLLVLGSSVYRKAGLMYRLYKELHGGADADPEDVCWFTPSLVMNPKLSLTVIDKAIAEDPARNRAEFLNEWRSDLTGLIPPELVDQLTDFGVRERPPMPGIRYVAFADPAGGTDSYSGDSYTLAIGHLTTGKERMIVIDALREWKPRFVPSAVVAEYEVLLRSYGIHEVHSDRYSRGFHEDILARSSLTLRLSEYDTSENYRRSLPVLLSGGVRFVDYPTLRKELVGLERHLSANGYETIGHAKKANAHDDCATSVCGLIVTFDSKAYTPGFHDGRYSRGSKL